jgi:hypothetical protein
MATIGNLTQKWTSFYNSFVGVVELDTDDLSLERAKVKVREIEPYIQRGCPFRYRL